MDSKLLISELEKLLNGGGAHVSFAEAVADLPAEALGKKPYDLPYSIWQLVEHIRIAQWDMLEFCKNAVHKSPKWPDEYWPKEAEPTHAADFDASVAQIEADLTAFITLVNEEDLSKPISHGSGQTILREALQIADHTAYHTAEIIILRRLLKIWKS